MLADKKYSDHNVFLYTTDQPEYLKPCLKTSSRAKSMQASSSLRQPPLKGQKCRIVTPNKSVGHSVASYEPFIQYHEAYDPFQTSGKGENYADNNSSSLLEGHIAQATVLNDTSALKTQTHKSKKISEVKTAGISTTVVHLDPTEVYKHLQREDARKLDNPISNSGFGQPFSTKFLTSPDAPYKRIDLVKQRKKMEQNSMALLRLKEKIQRQKQRSPSVDGSRKAEGFSPTNQVFLRPSTERNHDNHIIRKTAVGPVAPKYKGFSTTETRIQTPDGKVWKGGDAAAVRSYHPMKKPKAVSSLFESKQASKVHAASNSRKNRSKSANPIRKTGKVRLDHPTHKKSMITPSSWREGRRVAESILGPPPKQPKRIVAIDVTKPDQNKELPSKPDPLLSAKPNQEKLSTIARGVLNDLGLGSEDEADNKKFDLSRRQREADRSRRPKTKHQPTKVSGDSKIKMEKTRHYDQSEVQQYIAKQKADRKRKQSQERKANKDAYEKKQKQLDELYRKQKEAASAKRKLMASGGQLSKQQSTHEHVAGDWVVKEDDSDKENEENEQNAQGQSKFDERMSALMEKLDQYRPSTTQSTNSYKVPNKEPDKHFEYNNIPNSNMPSSSNTASEFMQKLDQYLRDDVPVPMSLGTKSRSFENAHREPEVHANLTIEDLDTQFSSKVTNEVEITDPPDNFVPRPHDQGLKQRLRCEKIAALKAKAESLQERINVESKRLVEQPFVPVKTSLQDVDAILRRSPRYPSIPPTNAWSPERIGSSSIPVRSIHIGVDVPDSPFRKEHFQEVELPGVSDLHRHVDSVQKQKSENEATLFKINSEFRSKSPISSFPDEWRLTTEGLRNDRPLSPSADEEEQIASSSQSSSRSSKSDLSQERNTPLKLRSVEEILKEMKSKEYAVSDPQPLPFEEKEIQSNIFGSTSRKNEHDLLTDLKSSIFPKSPTTPVSPVNKDQPPWERTGGDKYSVVNLFTSKYLKALKSSNKEKNKDKESNVRAKESVQSVPDTSMKSELQPPNQSSSAPMLSTSHKQSETASSRTDKYPHIDDTIHDDSESLSSTTEDSSKPRKMSEMELKKVDEDQSVIPKLKSSTSQDIFGEKVPENKENSRPEDSISFSSEKSDVSMEPIQPVIPIKTSMPVLDTEKKFSPAALELKLTAELNYQEAIEESLRHIVGVERTQHVSQAQQETVSLAQLMKARQLEHEVEMEKITIKAKEEALEAERKRQQSEEKLKMKPSKSQGSYYGTSESQMRSRRSEEKISDYFDSNSTSPSRSSKADSYSISESISNDTRTDKDLDEHMKDASIRKDKKSYSPRIKNMQKQRIIHRSDSDTESSITEEIFSARSQDKLDLDKTLPSKKENQDSSDRSITEDILDQSNQSSIHSDIGKASKPRKSDAGQTSDSSDTSLRFDEALTEDEIAEISRRVVVPSESHRRHQRRRGTGSLDKSDLSSDEQLLSSARQKSFRGGATKGLDDFNIGSSLPGGTDNEFVHFMDQMVRQYMLEEEVRAKHQAAMLKLRERAIKEKSETELSWLEQVKKQVRNKGDDDKMPPIKKKQRAILLRLKLETAEIKKLKAVTKAASHERKMFLQQQKENAARRAKLRAAEEELDGEIAKVKSKSQESNLASNNSVPNIDLSNSPDLEDVSESNSELDTSSTSSVLMKKLKKQIPGVLDEHRLTKREQRLNQRKKQAEQLIAWKKKLDNEEKKVYNIEKKALSVWEKDPDNKSEKTKHSSFDSTENSRPKKLASKDELSIADESPSAKSPESEHHSSPPPPSRSESSIAEEISQLNSETNSSISAISPEQNNEKQRYQEELSDGTNAEYSQSFESLTASQKSPRSPKSRSEKSKVQKSKPAKSTTKVEDSSERKPGDTSPSATSLLPTKSRDEKRPILTSKKATGREQESALQRRESAESWSDESFSQTQSETEQSDIECRVRALKEELKRRRLIAERLKKEQKRRHKDRLKAQEASLRSQIEAYDVFIQKTQSELTQELDHQLNTNASHTAVSKPQIRSPRKSDQARQSARAIRSTTAVVVSPEASPRSGYQRPHVLGKHRTESESSGKSSRSLSFDDEEKTDEAATPNGSTKSFPGVVAPLPSKHQEKLLQLHSGISSSQHDGTISTASIPTDKSSEKLKRIDLTDSAATLSKLSGQVQTTVEASVTMPTPGVAIDKPKSLIPIPSKLPLSLSKSAPVISTTPTSPSLQPSPSASEQSAKLSKKSLIPIPISSSLDPLLVVAKQKGKSDLSPSSSLGSERSLEYSEHFESESTKTKDDDSIETDENISEHFSINSSATSSDKSAVLFNLPAHEETKKSLELNKEDSLQSVEDFENDQQDNDDNEKTPVMSPAHTPIPSSPRDAFPFQEQIDAPFHIGDTVCLAERENGIVRFVGKTSFAPGIWVGAELKGANGKNDGSVDGVRYFTCKPKHGIFAPIARVSLVSSKSKIEAGIKDIVKDDIEKDEKLSPKDEDEHSQKDLKADNDDKTAIKEPVLRSDFDRNRLAEELGDKLLNSLLEDSVTHILESHTDKQQRLSHGNENLSPEQEPEEEKQDLEDAGKASDDEDNVLLSASTKQLLEMLSSSPEQVEEPEEKNEPNEITSHESLADTFTGDLLKDTLIKVLEIRRQRVKKWQHMEENEEQPDKTFEEDSKLDDGHEVEDILEAKNRNSEYIEDEEKDSTTPVRPVSPIFGTSQDDGLDEWFEDDIGITGFHKKKPTISKDDVDFTGDEDDLWQDGRLIEVLSGRTEPVPPPKFVVPHKPGVILKLVKEATNYYYSKFLGGELLTDTQIPDFLFNVSSDDSSKDENSDKEIDEEKKEADLNADHIFKTSLFDMVRELITEIYNIKSSTEENLKRPLWLKKKTVCRPSYCRRMPETEDEIVKIVSKQVSKLLNLSNDPQKLDPKITMKWGSRRKKDKVDLILIQELREEEPEWTNYDEDETTVKMQLTDTVLDMLVSDTVHCLNNIQQKVTDRKTKDEHNDHDPEERSL